MTLVLIIIGLVTLIGLPVGVRKYQKPTLSEPAGKILKEYNRLPADSQRLGDLEDKLRTLDQTLGVAEVNKAYSKRERTYSYSRGGFFYESAFSWSACRNDSKFYCYYEIADAVGDLSRAVQKQAEVMQLASIGSVDVKSLVETLRNETEVIREVTSDMRKQL